MMNKEKFEDTKAVNQGTTDNKITKTNRTKGQIMIYKTPHRT